MNNQIRLKFHIYPFLERYDSYDENDFRMDIPPDCNCRKTKLKIGLGLKIIEDKGLLEEFKAYLKPSNRSIKASYEEVYQQHLKHTLPMRP